MLPLPVYENGLTVVSYIVNYTCDNYVIVSMYELALHTPRSVYALLVLFKTNYKSNEFVKLVFTVYGWNIFRLI